MQKKFYFLFALFTIFFITACSNDFDESEDNTSSRPFLGDKNAPVLIEEFSDLQCPACANISPQVEKVVRDNPTLARLVYYHFPLPQHRYASKAAEASECAADQGKFWEYIDAIFSDQKNLHEDLLYSVAKKLQLDENIFNECLKNQEKRSFVKADLKRGEKRGVHATPTLYIDGEKVLFGNAKNFQQLIQVRANNKKINDQGE